MKEFIENVTNPGWWLSIFFIGILINILAAFIKRLIDRFISKYSEKRRKRIEIKKKILENKVNEMLNDRMVAIEKKINVILYIIFMSIFTILLVSWDWIMRYQDSTDVFGRVATYGLFISWIILFFFFIYVITRDVEIIMKYEIKLKRLNREKKNTKGIIEMNRKNKKNT